MGCGLRESETSGQPDIDHQRDRDWLGILRELGQLHRAAVDPHLEVFAGQSLHDTTSCIAHRGVNGHGIDVGAERRHRPGLLDPSKPSEDDQRESPRHLLAILDYALALRSPG